MKVVIIEDENLPQRYLTKLLTKNYPYFKTIAIQKSIDESLYCLKKNPVDVVFIDIDYLEEKHIDKFKKINTRTHIVVTSAYFEKIYNNEIRNFKILYKPVCEKNLNQLINNILTNKKQKQ